MSRSSSILAVAAAVAIFGGATSATATVFNVNTAGLYSYGTVNMAGSIAGHGAFNRNEFAGALVLTGTTDAGKPFSVVTYCFDILHNINVGFNGPAAVSYTFKSLPVTNDLSGNGGTGNALSTSQIERMSGLARLGASLFAVNASNLQARMTAIQAAIWTVEYGLTASSFSPAGAQGYYDAYLAKSFPGASVPVLVASNAQGQIIGNIQGLGIGSVPEPASWALMIIGFGMVGVTARRRNRTNVSA